MVGEWKQTEAKGTKKKKERVDVAAAAGVVRRAGSGGGVRAVLARYRPSKQPRKSQ